MNKTESTHRRKYFMFYAFSVFTFIAAGLLSGIIFLKSNQFYTDDGTDQLACAESDEIENAKLAWGNLLDCHPYYNRPHLSKEEWKKIPGQNRPDLAAELDFLKTMDPALGAVPYDRLYKAGVEMQKEFDNRAPIAGINWVERGPNNIGGRSRAIMFDPNDGTNKKVWAGGVGGGLWYTNDITVANPVWIKVNDFWNNIAVTTIAYNPANTQEFYVGTGEGWINSDGQSGSGIWKSSNGGGTWSQLAATLPGAYNSASDFHYVQKIVVKVVSGNGYVFATTRGYYVDVGGIMRSTDGGTTWALVKDVYSGAGTLYDRAADIEVAANGDLFASFGIHSEGKVFKSLNADNGAAGTWTDLSAAVVIGAAKRIELACAPSNASYIYAVGHGGSGFNDTEWVKRSTNGGTTWSPLAIPRYVDDGTTHFTNGQAWFDLILAVHPTNADLVIAGGVDLHRSTNGGTNWTEISHRGGGFSLPYVHADQHGIRFRPGASNEVLFSNDGGIWFSTNAGNSAVTPTFSSKNSGFNITQFYTCATREEFNGNYFLAGSQDNGTQRFTMPLVNSTYDVTGADGSFCHIDPLDPDIHLGSYQYNNLFRSMDNGASYDHILANSSGQFINPSDYDQFKKILYSAGANDKLIRNDSMNKPLFFPVPVELSISVGGSMVSAVKVSPYNDDILLLGISNGRVYKYTNASTGSPTLTRIDNGTTPITTAGWVSSIDVGQSINHILVTYSNYGVVSVWQTTDGGVNWYNKEGNLPDIPIRWAIYNPNNRNQVLAATEIGVYTTDNFGPTTNAVPVWGTSNTGLANTRCDMLKYRQADGVVVVATHGRGLFTTDVFAANPSADFIANNTASCSGSLAVVFTDKSFRPNGTWAWDVDNNGSTDYTTQNPTHTYNTPGTYSVKLTVNAGMTSTTKQNFITVMTSPPTVNTGCAFVPNSNGGNGAAIGLYRFKLGEIDHYTSHNDGYYQNYVCTKATSLSLNTLYNVTVQTGWLNAEGAGLFIDYNDNATFEDPAERAVTFPVSTDGTRTLSFTTPTTDVKTRKGLRARVLSLESYTPEWPCDIFNYGQAEDYTVYFNCTLLVTLITGTGAGSLPAAINCANPGDTVRLSASLAGLTINIGSSTIALNKNLVFIALGANTNITSSGTGVFDIASGRTIEMRELKITAGTSLTAGAINNNGILKLHNTNLYRNPSYTAATVLRNSTGAQCITTGSSGVRI